MSDFRYSVHTWKGNALCGKGQIDYIMASNRWKSCFTNAKVQWCHSRVLKVKERDHGLVLATFRWRLGKRKRRQHINWRALKPVYTVGEDAANVNHVLDSFEQGFQDQWERTGKYVARGDPLMTLNWVTTCVGNGLSHAGGGLGLLG